MQLRERFLAAAISVVMIGFAGYATAASTASAPAATPVVVKDAKGVSYTGDVAGGEKTFRQCVICHSNKDGENKIGPHLFNVIGRKAGTVAKYSYSPANKKSGIVWSEQAMFEYLENPRAKMPGTKMSFAGLKKPQDRANVVAYLKTLKPAAKPK